MYVVRKGRWEAGSVADVGERTPEQTTERDKDRRLVSFLARATPRLLEYCLLQSAESEQTFGA
jgi:hypothetical protein